MTADRYLLIGPTVPVIYPGDLENLMQALHEAARVSSRVPGRHRVIALRGRTKQVLQVYELGECVWLYQEKLEAN